MTLQGVVAESGTRGSTVQDQDPGRELSGASTDARLTETVPVINLQIPKSFLEQHGSEIASRLAGAAECFGRGESNYGYNRALHLSSSVVLNGAANYKDCEAGVAGDERFAGVEVTTLISIATLHHLLAAAPREVAEPIARAFAAKDWIVGKNAMEALGIRTADAVLTPAPTS